MKPNRNIPLVVAVLVVLAIIAGTAIQRGRDTVGPDDDAAAAAASTTDPTPAPASPGAGRAGDRSGAPPAPPQSLVERRNQMRDEHGARTRALREQSEQRFASEQVDPAWAPQKEAELTGLANLPAFEVADAQPRSLSVDCRSSMCRIDGQFESNGKAEDWILMYMSSVGGAMPNSVVSRNRNPDGSTEVRIYGRAR